MRAVRILGNVSMVVVCVIAVAFAALSLTSRGDPSDVSTWTAGFKPFVVLSGSMEPQIPVGGVLLVRRVDPATVKTGDVVTFVTPQDGSATQQEDSVTTHRILAVTADAQGGLAFSTKGDANEDVDPLLVPASSVLGSAVFSVPYLGYISRFASTRTGLLILIVVPALALAAMEIVSIVRNRSRKRAAEAAAKTAGERP